MGNKVTPVKKVEIKKVEVKPQYPKISSDYSDRDYSTVEEVFTEDIDIDDGCSIDVTVQESAKSSGSVYFEMGALPMCCGVLELGELRIRSTVAKKRLAEVLDTTVAHANGRTLVINTNGKDSSVQFEAALATCKNWTLVKTFKNPGSNNTIKMWVSNN